LLLCCLLPRYADRRSCLPGCQVLLSWGVITTSVIGGDCDLLDSVVCRFVRISSSLVRVRLGRISLFPGVLLWRRGPPGPLPLDLCLPVFEARRFWPWCSVEVAHDVWDLRNLGGFYMASQSRPAYSWLSCRVSRVRRRATSFMILAHVFPIRDTPYRRCLAIGYPGPPSEKKFNTFLRPCPPSHGR